MPIRLDLSGIPPGDRAGLARASLRARPGVAVFIHRGGATLTAATGDLRVFVADRLAGGGPRTDLGSVTDAVLACETGSGFEADVACEAASSWWTPTLHRQSADRRRCVFLELDPEGDVPVWRYTDLADCIGSDRPGTLIGPFAHRSAAEAFGRMLDDRFELCREPGLLAQRPGARACAYKDMGRCPAPCDGSEPMDSYRERARGALDFARRGSGPFRAEIEASIASASASLDFERAAAAKADLDMLDGVSGPAFAWVTTLDRFVVLAVLPSGRRGWARLMWHRAGETRHLFDLDAKRAEETIERAWGTLISGPPSEGHTLTRDGVDAIGLVCAHIFSGRRARSTFFPLDHPPDPADVVRAVRRAAKVDAEATDEQTETT